MVDLKEADWVEIGDREGRTLRIAIGRSDHLPIRSVLTERDAKTGEKSESSTYYTTYHLIDGIQTPFRESRYLNERQTYQAFFERCSYNVGSARELLHAGVARATLRPSAKEKVVDGAQRSGARYNF